MTKGSTRPERRATEAGSAAAVVRRGGAGPGLSSPELPVVLYEVVGDVADAGCRAAHDEPLGLRELRPVFHDAIQRGERRADVVGHLRGDGGLRLPDLQAVQPGQVLLLLPDILPDSGGHPIKGARQVPEFVLAHDFNSVVEVPLGRLLDALKKPLDRAQYQPRQDAGDGRGQEKGEAEDKRREVEGAGSAVRDDLGYPDHEDRCHAYEKQGEKYFREYGQVHEEPDEPVLHRGLRSRIPACLPG